MKTTPKRALLYIAEHFDTYKSINKPTLLSKITSKFQYEFIALIQASESKKYHTYVRRPSLTLVTM